WGHHVARGGRWSGLNVGRIAWARPSIALFRGNSGHMGGRRQRSALQGTAAAKSCLQACGNLKMRGVI
ncbi:unnamed protein product, partial [Musa acuminata subsp. burmannicoides]